MPKTNTDIVLIVDHKWRDLPGMAALAVYLEQFFRLQVRLSPYTLWRESLVWHRPRIVVVSSLKGVRGEAIVRMARAMGVRLAIIMTEGRMNNMQGLGFLAGQESGLENADLCFTWSELVKQYILEQGVLPESKVVVAGSHRFDFYREPLKQLVLSKNVFCQQHGFDPSRPIVSWATNFTHAKFHHTNQEFLVSDWKNLGLLKYSYYSKPWEVAQNDFEVREESFKVMKSLLAAKPDIQLALKPHPAEDRERYQQFVIECRNEFGPRATLVGFQYIWDMLNSSSVHIHRLCTTGVEAWLMDVPSIELHIRDYAPWSIHIPGSASEAVKGNEIALNSSALIGLVDYYLKGGGVDQQKMQFHKPYLERWLYAIDGNRVSAHAKHLAELAGWSGRIRNAPFSMDTLLACALPILKKFLGRKPEQSFSARLGQRGVYVDKLGQMDKIISQDDIEHWRARVKSIYSSFSRPDQSIELDKIKETVVRE